MAIIPNAQIIKQSYIDACNAVIERGGTVPSGMGILGLADKIANIPQEVSLGYHEANSESYISDVPLNAEGYARIKRIGGMSYKCSNHFDILGVGYTTSKHFNPTTGVEEAWAVGWSVTGYIPVKANTKYYVSEAFTSAFHGCAVYYNVNKEQISFYRIGEGIAFTTPESCAYVRTNLLVSLKDTAMMNEGEELLPYEPFFGGFKDISITTLKSEGANLLPFPYCEGAITKNGVTFTLLDDGGIHIKGTPDQHFIYNLSVGIKFFDLTYIGAVTTNLYATDGKLCLSKSGTLAKQMVLAYDRGSIHLEFTATMVGKAYDGTLYPMLNYGTTAKPYKPYIGEIDTLKIPDDIYYGILSPEGYGAGIDNTYYNYIDFERKVFVQKVGTVVLDGTEEMWTSYANENGKTLYHFWFGGLVNSDANGIGICNHYDIVANHNDIYIHDIEGVFIDRESLTVYDEYYSSLEVNEEDAPYEWKNHLAELYANGNPLVIIYALAEPIETDISDMLFDEFIKIEGGGTITALDYEKTTKGVPTTINYLIDTVGG